MRVVIETIPHAEQRYPTVGDWLWSDDETTLTIRVSDMGDWRSEMLVALHELVEVILCKAGGVEQQAVDAFDIEFERKRAARNLDEPGDDPAAPYRDEHC